jgi:predicted nucleic acid-binding protein
MRFYLDSMVWIYALEGNDRFGSPARSLLQKLRSANDTILVSDFLLGEVLVLPIRQNDAFLTATYKRLMSASSTMEVIPFTNQVGINFATFRALYRTQPADSIHLALAAAARADFFITSDDRLQKLTIPGIGQVADLNLLAS